MKLTTTILCCSLAVVTAQKGGPSPVRRLNKLVDFSHEMLDAHFDFLPSRDSWKAKFDRNADRMLASYNRLGMDGERRCGSNNQQQDERLIDTDRYNTENPFEGARQITTGFRKWAERYIGNCAGQKQNQHQVKRMNRWNAKLQSHLSTHHDTDEVVEGSGGNNGRTFNNEADLVEM